MHAPTAGSQPTCLWIHTNCDLAMHEYAAAMSCLVHFHIEGARMMADGRANEITSPIYGGEL